MAEGAAQMAHAACTRIWRTLRGIGLIAYLGSCSRAKPGGADFVIRDASVYTVDDGHPRAQAVVVAGGRIVYVGTNDSAQTWVSPKTEVLRVPGRMVLPGFVDSHVHPLMGALKLGDCDLRAATTLDALRRLITACARTDTSAWFRGFGWDLTIFPGGNPSRVLLDSLVPDRPALLAAADAHSAWVNSRALALAGVTRATHDPPAGHIERDATGAPSGTLRDYAQSLVEAKAPPYSDARMNAALDSGLAIASRFGITTLHDAAVTAPFAAAYARADSLGRLPVRVVLTFLVDPLAPADSEVRRIAALRTRTARGLLRPISAKILMDGVFEGETAALLEPYRDRPGYRGSLKVSPAKFDTLVRALDSAGFKVHVHAIGDRAVRAALDGFEQQYARDRGAGPRHIIAHLQLVDPSDIPRFAKLGVIASIQPFWAYADDYIRDFTIPVLGPTRSRWLYPFASIAKTGAMIAGGSDWPVTTMNPLDAIEVAVTRRAPGDTTGQPLIPEEALDLPTILRAYTLGGAVASEADSLTGSLIAGKAADLVVLSDDLFKIPAHRIATARVLLTMMGGRVTYRDSTLARQPR
jgi:hypothetical protein